MTNWALDEVELVRRCRDGSDAAYAVLVRGHRSRLFTLAYRLTGDRSTAEDVVQEAFLVAFKAIDRFEPKPSLAAWLNTITVRIAKRAAFRERARGDTNVASTVEGADSQVFGAGVIDGGMDVDPVASAESAELRAQVRPRSSGCPSTTAPRSSSGSSPVSTMPPPPTPWACRSTRSRATCSAGRGSSGGPRAPPRGDGASRDGRPRGCDPGHGPFRAGGWPDHLGVRSRRTGNDPDAPILRSPEASRPPGDRPRPSSLQLSRVRRSLAGCDADRLGTPLDCASARVLIDAYLLGALEPASRAALRVHLAGCAECSLELRGFTSLVELMATMPSPSPPRTSTSESSSPRSRIAGAGTNITPGSRICQGPCSAERCARRGR